MRKRILIFDYDVLGHNLEYLHHIYKYAEQDPKADYTFLLPIEFETHSRFMENWGNCKHITFSFFHPKKAGFLMRHIHANYILIKALLKKKYDDTILVVLDDILPFCFLPIYRTSLHGITYSSYLYYVEKGVRKIRHDVNYWVCRWAKNLKTIFILNDSESAEYLNRKYSCSKFKYLPDPFERVEGHEYSSSALSHEGKIVISHIGAMSRRKGTLEILAAIDSMPAEKLEKYVFYLVGQVSPQIKEQVYLMLDKIGAKAHIILKDDFCSYSYIREVIALSDFVLLPYLISSQSSGILAYAAEQYKPVIGPTDGLLGKLIKDYDLGIVMDNCDSGTIAKLLCSSELNKVVSVSKADAYLQKNSVANFVKTLFFPLSQ